MAGASPSSSPQKINDRWPLLLVALFMLCVLAVAIVFFAWRASLSKKINRTLLSIHAAGYPTNLAEVEQQYYPQIPPNENAAPFFQSAFALLQVTNKGKDLIPDLPDYQSEKSAAFFSREKLLQINQLLAANQNALEILRQTSPAANCRYPVKLDLGIELLLPHLSPLRASVKLLDLDAILHSKNGDSSAAINDLGAVFRLCHSLDREPILLSQLVRMTMQSHAITSLEYILNSVQLADSQLAYLSQVFHESEKCPGKEHFFATELCTGMDAFRLAGLTGPLPVTNTVSGYALIRLTGFFHRDFDFYIETMSQYMQLQSTTFPAKIDALKTLDRHTAQECSNHYYLVSRMLFPSFGNTAVRECSLDARLAIVQTVLAIERFRLANQNRLPDKLDDLVPANLPSLPTDLFDGKPIRYKKLAKGYMVYSVGEDRKDDGGVYAQPAQRLKPGAPSDITFVVER